MDIFCPACQQKMQIADIHAGQTVKCPSCAANFQAPALPGTGPLPPPLPLVPPPSNTPTPAASVPVAPGAAPPALPSSTTPPTAPQLPPGEYHGNATIHLRRDVIRMIPPIGMLGLVILSFLPWRLAVSPTFDRLAAWTTLNLWQLAFTQAGLAVFVLYVLLLIIAVPVVFLTPLFERNLLPAPALLRPYLTWGPLLIANLTLAAWLFFLIHYVHCTIIEPFDPATLWMKLAFRLHTLMVIAAFLDIWLMRRQRRGLPEPSITMHW